METMSNPLRDVIKPLTAHDRCDHPGCDAQAYIAVLLRIENEAPLLWCGHHGRKVLPALMAQHPFAVRDDIQVLADTAAR